MYKLKEYLRIIKNTWALPGDLLFKLKFTGIAVGKILVELLRGA